MWWLVGRRLSDGRRWTTVRPRTGLAFLDQKARWWRRQLRSPYRNAPEVRWHRSFDHRACRTTLRETRCRTAADMHQPYFRRAPYEGLVFILSVLSTADATHVSSLFLGREPQNRAPWPACGDVMFLGSRVPLARSSTFPGRFHGRRRGAGAGGGDRQSRTGREERGGYHLTWWKCIVPKVVMSIV